MKNLILMSFLIAFINSIVFAQTQNTFEKAFGTSGSDVGVSVCATQDGGYAAVGYSDGFGNGNDIYVVKFDSLGRTIWWRNFNFLGDDGGNDINQTAFGELVICGYTKINSSSSADVILIKLTANGSLIFSKQIGTAGDEIANRINILPNGNYMMGGYYKAATNPDGLIYITDTSGTVLQTKIYGLASNESFVDQTLLMDGNVMLVSGSTSGSDKIIWAVKVNSIGDTIFTKQYAYSGYNHFAVYAVLELEDSSIIISGGSNWGAGSAFYAEFYQKIDKNGVLISYYDGHGNNYSDQGLLANISPGSYLVGDTYNQFQCFVRGASGFAPVATSVLTANHNSYCNALIRKKEGSPQKNAWIMVGRSKKAGYGGAYNDDLVIAKIDENYTTKCRNNSPVISAKGSTSFCTGDSVLLSLDNNSKANYHWAQIKYPPNFNMGTHNDSIWIKAAGFYELIGFDSDSNMWESNIINVTITGTQIIPVITATSSTALCSGDSVKLNASPTGTGITYQWKLNGSSITGATLSSLYVSTAGNYTCDLTNTCGSTTSNSLTVTQNSVTPPTPGTITGIAKPCPGANGVAYSVAAVANANTYNWTMPNGASIVSGAGTRAITVNFATNFVSGNISVSASNACGKSGVKSKSVSRNIPNTPSNISGTTAGLCGATNKTYSVTNVAGVTWQWTVPAGANIVSGQGTRIITVNFPSTNFTGTISVTASNTCGTSAARNLSVKAKPGIPVSITGPATACANQQNVGYSTAAVVGATSYTWGVPTGAAITSGQGTNSIVMNFGTTSGNVKVRAENSCGASSYKNLAVTINCREGDDELGDWDVVVYPNPSKDVFEVKLSETPALKGALPDNGYSLVIRDVIGRVVYEKKNILNDGFEFGGELKSGVYFAEVKKGDVRKIVRVIRN